MKAFSGMSDLNMVALIGRLTRDAELKYTASGIAVCKFSVAVNRKRKDGDNWVDEASFFDVVLWGRQGEALNHYLTKGKQVGVNGELRQERWQDRDSCQGRSKVEIIADNIQLLGGGNENGENGGGNYGGSPRSGNSGGNAGNGRSGNSCGNGNTGVQAAVVPKAGSENDDGFTDDIPF
jgi:single-strand DNA-binding protein